MRLRQGIAAGVVLAAGLVVPARTASAAPVAPAVAKKCDGSTCGFSSAASER